MSPVKETAYCGQFRLDIKISFAITNIFVSVVREFPNTGLQYLLLAVQCVEVVVHRDA
jgi:hypothetical protein